MKDKHGIAEPVPSPEIASAASQPRNDSAFCSPRGGSAFCSPRWGGRGISVGLLAMTYFLILCQSQTAAWAMARKPPEPTAEEAFSSSPRRLTLHDCYELALEQSETVAIRKQEIERAKAQIFTATSEAVGDVDFEITDFHQENQDERRSTSSGLESSSTAEEKRERKFVLSQPIFQGFKAVGALTAAGSLRKQRKEEWIRATELLFLDVATAFYSLLRYERDVDALREIQRLFKERLGELGEREQIGRSRMSELANARARMKIVDAQLSRARSNLKNAQHILTFLTGLEIKIGDLEDPGLPPGPEGAMDFFLDGAEYRSDVEASRQAVKTARGGVIAAQSSLWPEVTLDGNFYEKREGFQSGIDWDLLITINIPLFKGGETVGAIKESVGSWKIAKFTHSLAEREAELEIKQAYENWAALREESHALEEAVAASRENFKLQKEEYTRSLVSNLDVLDALESLQETRREAIRSHYEMKENYWRLAVATGRLKEVIPA